jgi:hypothetical protein
MRTSEPRIAPPRRPMANRRKGPPELPRAIPCDTDPLLIAALCACIGNFPTAWLLSQPILRPGGQRGRGRLTANHGKPGRLDIAPTMERSFDRTAKRTPLGGLARHKLTARTHESRLTVRGKGITNDTGFFIAGSSTHQPFEAGVVKREMRVIHNDFYCNAVRITGGDADRLEVAAEHAAEAGLEVFHSPFSCDLSIDEPLHFLFAYSHPGRWPLWRPYGKGTVRRRQHDGGIVTVEGHSPRRITAGGHPNEDAPPLVAERLFLLASTPVWALL